jgi:diguanylate cyclase (GGDEF)-like protein
MPDASSQTTLRWPVLLVVLLGLAAAYFTWYYAAQDEAAEKAEAFRRLGVSHAARLEDLLHARATVLTVLAAAIARDPVLDPKLLREMVDRAERVPGREGPVLRYVAWAPRVLDAGLADYVAARRAEDPGFGIRRPDGADAREGQAHVVLDMLWPAALQTRLAGMDLAADPARRETFERALQANAVAPWLSGQLDLADPSPGESRSGVMLCVPVYPGGVSLGADEQRHEALLGYVVAECSPRDLLETAFARELQRPDADASCISVWDENAVIAMLGRSPVLTSSVTLHPIDVLGRTWRVETRPSAEREPTLSESLARPSTLLPSAVLLVMCLAAGIVWIIQRQTAFVHRQVEARTAELREKNEALETKEFELQELNRRLLEMSNTDALTGILNRRAFEHQYVDERERSTRGGQAFGLLLFDIDHFKGFNDLYGHVKGDEVLRRVAQIIRNEARRIDCVARYGGEEFVVLASGADANGLMSLGERVRARVQEAAIENHSAPLGVITVSGGGALSGAAKGRDPRELIEIADRCLYQAKTSGRNRVAMVM